MQVYEGLAGLRSLPAGAVVSIGNFDGVHLGHARILHVGKQLCEDLKGKLAVVTFEPHPLTVIKPELAPPRLTPPVMKRELLERAGVDHYVILPPEPDVLNLSAEAFWQILRDEVRPKCLVEGESFNFGKNRAGTIERLREWTKGTGVALHVVDGVFVPLMDLTIVPISSSLIRWLIGNGRVRDAAICLGRPYALRGEVVKGYGRGKQLGVATANIKCDDQLIPCDGVYAARCATDGRDYPTALSIGTLPTFGNLARQVEAHLIGLDRDLYGLNIEVRLIDWIRDQRKFPSIDSLKEKIASDLSLTLSASSIDPTQPIARAG